MSIPMHKRKFNSFISAAYADRELVGQIESWLVDKAGMSVWCDAQVLPAGTSIEAELEKTIVTCQSMILVLSRRAIESGWVKREFEAGIEQQTQGENVFPIIPIRIEECVAPDFLQTAKWIDISKNGFNLFAANELLFKLYPASSHPGAGKGHDVFISRSWKQTDSALPDAVCTAARYIGFQLVGNLADRQNDVRSVIAGCGGFIAIFSSQMSEKAKKQIMEEMEIANTLKLPCFVVAEESVEIPESVNKNVLEILRVKTANLRHEEKSDGQIHSFLLKLQEEWVNPPKPQYIFYGTDLKDEHKHRNRIIRRAIQQVSSMPCLVGEEIHQGHVQQEITNMVVNSCLMVADVSKENLNTCIEAGIAIGANVPVHLLSEGERRKPPFMFRDRQIWHYENDVDLIGLVHKLVLPYRRHMI